MVFPAPSHIGRYGRSPYVGRPASCGDSFDCLVSVKLRRRFFLTAHLQPNNMPNSTPFRGGPRSSPPLQQSLGFLCDPTTLQRNANGRPSLRTFRRLQTLQRTDAYNKSIAKIRHRSTLLCSIISPLPQAAQAFGMWMQSCTYYAATVFPTPVSVRNKLDRLYTKVVLGSPWISIQNRIPFLLDSVLPPALLSRMPRPWRS